MAHKVKMGVIKSRVGNDCGVSFSWGFLVGQYNV